MQTVKYEVFKVKHMDLDLMYAGDINTLNTLDYNLKGIIETEAPITLNILKARLREAFNIGKISGKALEIIEAHIKRLGFKTSNNLYDITLWPATGMFDLDCLRVGYERQIYDIPYEELLLLVISLNLQGEELYREVLKYFGYEVLTAKAREYLEFVEKKL